VWAPDNKLQRRVGIVDDRAKVERYLDTLIGDKSDEKMRMAYADQAGEMLDYMDKLGRVNFSHVRPPVPEFALMNGTLMLRRPEVATLLGLRFEETERNRSGHRYRTEAWHSVGMGYDPVPPRHTLSAGVYTCCSNALAKYGALH
jgi:hypothetical protein